MIDINTGDIVSFSLYSGINGTTTLSGKVQAKLTHELASVMPGSNLVTNHTNIWPLLPQEVKDNYTNSHTSYEYIALKTNNGTVYFIGIPWIREATLEKENPKTAELVLGNFTEVDGVRLGKILAQHNYTVKSFKINI